MRYIGTQQYSVPPDVTYFDNDLCVPQTALMLAACLKLREKYNLCAVTNDIFTREDAEFLVRHSALSEDRILAVETGGCPHAAIRVNIIFCVVITVFQLWALSI